MMCQKNSSHQSPRVPHQVSSTKRTQQCRARMLMHFYISCDLRRSRRGSLSTKTPHQCKNVCDWKTTERDQPGHSSALSSHTPSSKCRKTSLPAVAIKISEGGARPFDLQNCTQNREAHKQNKGNLSFRRMVQVSKTVSSQEPGFTLKERTWAPERLLLLSCHSESQGARRFQRPWTPLAHIPHFLAQKIN